MTFFPPSYILYRIDLKGKIAKVAEYDYQLLNHVVLKIREQYLYDSPQGEVYFITDTLTNHVVATYGVVAGEKQLVTL